MKEDREVTDDKEEDSKDVGMNGKKKTKKKIKKAVQEGDDRN